MVFNRIAVYGHRGWAGSAIVSALAASKAPVRILYRSSSDISTIPSAVTSVEVDIDNQEALVAALKDIDIVISLVGHEGVDRQHAFVKAIPRTQVKLFVPSDLGHRCDEQGLRVPINKAKFEVEQAAKQAGIPTTVVLPGFFTESTIRMPLLGVDYDGNRIIFTGDSANQRLNMCTRDYVAAGYASIFSSTPIDEIKNRAITLSELRATGSEIVSALEKKHGSPPQIIKHSIEQVDEEFESNLREGKLLAMSWYLRKLWGIGKQEELTGKDFWEVDGYKKTNLEELIVGGGLAGYRTLPPERLAAIKSGVFKHFDA